MKTDPRVAAPPAESADPAEAAPTIAAFGRWLRRQREVRELSRDDVVRATRLAPAVIDGLESGDPARMPPAGYVYGYLRTYEGAPGLDADEVVLRWQEVEAAAAPDGEDAPSPGGSSRATAIAVGGAVVLALAAAAAWLLR